ncbi:WD repeat-containing protein 96, partial [Dufourea novaeangliae]
RFNERFEELRAAKESETKTAIEHANQTRRCAGELMKMYGVDASTELLDASLWRRKDTMITDESFEEDLPDSLHEEEEEAVENDHSFRRRALEQMMDGVLEVGLKEKAMRSVPLPPVCLAHKDPSRYSREDIETIEAYERRLRASRDDDRLAYRSTLEATIERAKEEFWCRAKTFDDQLDDLAAEKICVERSVLLERLSESRTILQHRQIARNRRKIRRIIELELTPAVTRSRNLVAECELFEAGVIELRNRYEALRKRDKLLEEKYRADLRDSKQQPIAEQLLRHYRKRPRTVTACCGTSLAFLGELADCVLEQRGSELLPRDWVDYLRAMNNLDAIPDSLPSRMEAEDWRSVCVQRRLKIEAEIKARICAIELAEAEQSLAFHRKMCSIGRASVNRSKETMQQLDESLTDLIADQEVHLLLKTEQLREQPRGNVTSDWAETVLIPRRELIDTAEAIAAAGRRKMFELRRSINLERTVSREEYRRACLERTMEDLQTRLKDLMAAKV